jgi:hypothetical protein
MLARHAQLDIWDLPPDPGNTLSLIGFLNGIPVSIDGYAESSFHIQHAFLSLDGGPFDSFMISSSGPADDGCSFAVYDNVRISPVPEPSTFLLAALGGLALLAWRRRSAVKLRA